MTILIIILCVLIFSFIGVLFITNKEDRDSAWMSLLIGMTIVCVIICMAHETPSEKSLKNNSLKIEVRNTVIEGRVTESDTVYIFTPKTGTK
jgi:hypothetical protein